MQPNKIIIIKVIIIIRIAGTETELCVEKTKLPVPAYHFFNESLTNSCDLWTLRKQKLGYQSKSRKEGKEAVLPIINIPVSLCTVWYQMLISPRIIVPVLYYSQTYAGWDRWIDREINR